jgi:transketolase
MCGLEPLKDKFEAFGWSALEVDGHDIPSLSKALGSVPARTGKPTVIIANTVKGKGISFMEDDPAWHHKVPDKEQYSRAVAELEKLEKEVTAAPDVLD